MFILRRQVSQQLLSAMAAFPTLLSVLASGLSMPSTADAADLYAAYFYDNTVHRFSPSGVDLGTFVANTGGYYPQSIALDSQGNLYVANIYASSTASGPPSIRKFSSSGADLGVVAQDDSISPYSLA